MSPSPDAIQTVPAGQSTAITLTGWSDVPTSPWPIAAATGTPSGAGCTFDPKPKLSTTQVGDGTSVTLTLSVPAGTPSSCVGLAYVSSGTKGLAYGAPPFWPFAIRSQ